MIGRVPTPRGWQAMTFADVVVQGEDAIVGGPFGSSLTTADYVDAGVPVIRGSNLAGEECRFIDDGFVYVSAQKAEELARNTARPGDMIFTQRGTLGQVAVIPRVARFNRYIVSQSQMRVRVREDQFLPRFLYWYYRSPVAIRYLQSRTLATGVPHINLGILKEFPVMAPDLPEQRRIAAILDEADTLRRKRREALALLDDLLRATFLDMFGDPVTNPRGWPLVALGDIVVDGLRNGLSPATGGNYAGRVLTLAAITGVRFNQEHAKDAVFDRAPDPSQFAHDGLFLICRGNGNLGLVGRGKLVVGAAGRTVFPDTMIAGRPDGARIAGEYLEAIWATRCVRDPIEAGANTTNGTHKVNQRTLGAIRFPLPPLQDQQAFGRFAAALGELRDAGLCGRADADALFASLLHRAFTGSL